MASSISNAMNRRNAGFPGQKTWDLAIRLPRRNSITARDVRRGHSRSFENNTYSAYPGFTDTTSLDFTLAEGADAIDAASTGLGTLPAYQYVDSCEVEARASQDDLGALEYAGAAEEESTSRISTWAVGTWNAVKWTVSRWSVR